MLCAAFVVANLGTGITAVAFPWLVTSVTREPLHVAGIVMIAELPWLLLSLPAGALIDRTDHRRVIASTHLFRALLVGGLAVVVLADSVTLAVLYGVAFLIGTMTVTNENATQTMLPRLVPSSALERANSHLVVADTAAGAFAGPLIGGALVGVALALPFLVDASLFLVAAVLVTAMAVVPRSTVPGPAQPLRTEMADGFRYFWRHPVLRSLGLFLGLLNLAGAIAIGTQVLFAQEILHLGAAQYGLLFSVGAVGAMVGATLTPLLERAFGARRLLLLTLAGNGAIVLVIGLTSSAIVVGLAIAVGAGLAVIWNVLTVSYRQRIVPEHVLGRVNSIYRMLSWGPLPLGSLLAGLVVTAGAAVADDREFGLRFPLFVSAAITLGMFVFALLRLNTGIWSRDRNEYRATVDQPGAT
jgi:MFS family permease